MAHEEVIRGPQAQEARWAPDRAEAVILLLAFTSGQGCGLTSGAETYLTPVISQAPPLPALRAQPRPPAAPCSLPTSSPSSPTW